MGDIRDFFKKHCTIDITDAINTYNAEIKLVHDRFYDLEHSEDMQKLRELRADCDDIKAKIQEVIDNSILDIHEVPDFRGKYLCIRTRDDSAKYVHVVDTDEWIYRLVHGIRLYISASVETVIDGENYLYTFSNEHPGDATLAWDTIKNVTEITADEFKKIINDAIQNEIS